MAAEGPRTHLEEPKIWQVNEKVPFKGLGEVAAKSRNLTIRDSGVPSWVNDTHTGSLSLTHISRNPGCHKSPSCNSPRTLCEKELGLTVN